MVIQEETLTLCGMTMVMSSRSSAASSSASRITSARWVWYVLPKRCRASPASWYPSKNSPTVREAYDSTRVPAPPSPIRQAEDASPMIEVFQSTWIALVNGCSPVSTSARAAGSPSARNSSPAISTASRPLAQACWVTANARRW